jgi:hypothetical protein
MPVVAGEVFTAACGDVVAAARTSGLRGCDASSQLVVEWRSALHARAPC